MQNYHIKVAWEEERIEQGIAPTVPGEEPQDAHTVQVESEVWRQGPLYHQILSVKKVPKSGDESTTEEFEAVLSEKYFAWYVDGNFRVYNFENLDSFYPPVDTHAKAWPRYDILRFGVGLDTTNIEEMYTACAKVPDAFKWSVLEEVAEGEERYKISVSRLRNSEKVLDVPIVIGDIILDPRKGFLAPHFAWFAQDGSVLSEVNVQLEKTPNGYWYPASGTVLRESGDWSATFQVDSIEVEKLNDPVRFRMESMVFKHENTRMDEFFPDGREPEIKGYHNGSWVPVHLLPEEKRNQIVGHSLLKPNAPTGKGERDEAL